MMKKGFVLLFTIWVALSASAQNHEWFNIAKKGASLKGDKLCTQIIQTSIDEASAQGGGVVYFPAGTYLTGSIHLKSNITLHLDAGALIKFSDNPDDYLPYVDVRWEGIMMKTFSPLIHAENAENITIEGRGTLDGQGKKWWDTILIKIGDIKKDGKISKEGKYEKMWEEQNTDILVSDYYRKTLKRKFFRPPFFQANKCNNIRISGVKFMNSPFWTINPIFCDNITIDGITINNPHSPNTDGINPSSCSNVHISNCHISVGDDCITIKSGRDADGRKYNVPCQNITITNCTMLNGHGGVVIGSEMSGSVRKITISNCIFDGTDRGIRLKASRERGGTVEEIRVDNVVMKNIQREAFMFNLFYDKSLPEVPVNEKTPSFKNIHISNVTGSEIKQACRIIGINEMPIQNLSFSDININAKLGFDISTAFNIEFHDVTINTEKGPSIKAESASKLVFDNVKTNSPIEDKPVIQLTNVQNSYIYNCFMLEPTNTFLSINGDKTEDINIWSNNLKSAKTPYSLNVPNKKVVSIQ